MLKMNSSRCAACKHLRRRCPSDCILSPYFPANNKKRFEVVHKTYGASNITKMLENLPVHLRAEAAESLCYEAYCRERDPVHGSVGVITILQQQIHNLQCQLAQIQAEIAVASAHAHAQTGQNHNIIQQPIMQQNFDGGFFLDQNGGSTASYDPTTWFY